MISHLVTVYWERLVHCSLGAQCGLIYYIYMVIERVAYRNQVCPHHPLWESYVVAPNDTCMYVRSSSESQNDA